MIRLTVLAGLIFSVPLAAQVPADLARERADYARWLTDAPNSPFAAVVQRPVGPGLTLGPPTADIPLNGIAPTTLRAEGAVARLSGEGGARVLPRLRVIPLGEYRLYLSGPSGRTVLTVYGPHGEPQAPAHHPYAKDWDLTVRLVPAARPGTRRILASDGMEVDATEAGTVQVPTARGTVTLRVLRIPTGLGEENDLEIYFRDETNGSTTYPAGRFVTLLPQGGDRYRLDFNRARNPFCAYNTVYACPAPWRGNTLPVPVTGGERYLGGGLEVTIP